MLMCRMQWQSLEWLLLLGFMLSTPSLVLSSSEVSSSLHKRAALLGHKWEATNFCKCICFGTNYTILHLEHPDNPSSPCLSCTKQWCLNQNLQICAGAGLGDTNPDTATGKEGDVEARCFQRDSPRDQLVVTLFLLTVFGLLLGAGIKGKMMKAGIDTSLNWKSGRRWWEAWLPNMQPAGINLGERASNRWFSRRANGDVERREEYVNLSTDAP